MEVTRVFERMRYHVSLTPDEAHALVRLTNSGNPTVAELAGLLEKMVDRQ